MAGYGMWWRGLMVPFTFLQITETAEELPDQAMTGYISLFHVSNPGGF
jgi:hypothetical protein